MTADSLFNVITKGLKRMALFGKAHMLSLASILILGGVLYIAFFRNEDPKESYVRVVQKPFLQEVSVSGNVQAEREVEMSFESTGRVEEVYVRVGDKVEEGAPLISLDADTLRAELLSAEAEVISRKNERANSEANLDEVIEQENTKVQTAYTALLSTDLVVRPQSDTYEATAPLVTGRYQGETEGVYKFRVRPIGSGASHELLVFDLETREAVRVSETGPTPLGTRGLFVTFPDDLSTYRDTTWYVEVPNKKSASYADLQSAYEEALNNRDVQIELARATLSERTQGGGIADAMLRVAEAEVARLTAELEKYTLRAPFSGTVTKMELQPGDTAPVNEVVTAVMSVDELEIESFVPEISISSISVGDPAVITLDAYGDSVTFPAHVFAIDPAETVRDGVSTYRARLAFDSPDERIRPGMTANILITTDRRENVISIPVGAVRRENGRAYVLVRQGETNVKRDITTGNTSSLGEVEVVSGLFVGEEVSVVR